MCNCTLLTVTSLVFLSTNVCSMVQRMSWRGSSEWARMCFDAGAEASIRFSLLTGDKAFDAQCPKIFQSRISSLPVQYVDVSSGFYNIDKQLIYPARPEILQARRSATLSLAKRHTAASFIYSGRALLESNKALPSNVHIGLCRDLIANPNYLLNLTDGCQNSGKCHYYSRGGQNVTCPRWKEHIHQD